MSRLFLGTLITALVALTSPMNVGLAGPYWERLPSDGEIQQAASQFTVPNRSIVDARFFKFHDPTYADDPIRANGVGLVYRVPNPDYDPANQDQPDLECGRATLNWWPDRGGWVFLEDGGGRRMCFSSTDTLDALVSRYLGTSRRLGWVGDTTTGNRPPRLELRPPENPELILASEYGLTYKYCFQALSYDDDKDEVTHAWFFDGQQISDTSTVQGSPAEGYSIASSYECWIPGSQGTHTVVVKASDGKGGTAEKEYSFTIKGQWVHAKLQSGRASLWVGDQQYDLEAGVPVSITDGIRSGSVSIRCWGGTLVHLVFADGSTLYFDCRSPSVHDDPGGGDISVDHTPLGEDFVVGPGNVRVHVRKVKINLFEAAGWHGGTLGTEFEIDVQSNGVVSVYTFDGVVWFADPQQKKIVHIKAGETSTGLPGSVPSDPKPFDPTAFERWWEGETPPPPSGGKTLEQALDTNNNKIIDDLEMLQALQYWIKQQTVPGTNKTIDDLTMLSLLQKWIKGTPVSSSALGTPGTLSVQALQIVSLRSHEYELRVRGQNIASVQARVFDLRGRLLLQEESAGATMRLALHNSEGAPWVNGIYLYIVTVEGRSGERWHSGVRKFIVLR